MMKVMIFKNAVPTHALKENADILWKCTSQIGKFPKNGTYYANSTPNSLNESYVQPR